MIKWVEMNVMMATAFSIYNTSTRIQFVKGLTA